MTAAILKSASWKIQRKLAACIFVSALVLLVGLPVSAQNQGGGNPNAGGAATQAQIHQPMPDTALNGPVGDPVFQERRIRMLSIATHKAMVSDTDKLLELATELSNEVGNTNPRSFTPDQLRKIAQIEKLARSVRDKMRITLTEPQDNIMAAPDLPHVPH